MKYSIQINQLAIIENGFNIKGTSLDTWALLDFLVFFYSAKNHKTLNKNGIGYVWINYNYIQDSMPLCKLYKQAIKKHLELLQEIGLIELIKDDSNNVYFIFTELMECLFVSEKKSTHLSKNLPTPKKDFTQPLSKILPSTININNKESIKNNNLYIQKEKNTKKEKDCVSLFQDTESHAQTQKELADSLFNFFGFEKENSVSASKAKEKQDDLESLENEFNQIWELYPKKQDKQVALNSYIKARKGSKIALKSKGNTKVAPQSFETILQGVKNYLRANRGVEIKFIKHLSTFLNQATYLDFQGEVNLNRRVGVIDDHEDYLNADKSIYIPK